MTKLETINEHDISVDSDNELDELQEIMINISEAIAVNLCKLKPYLSIINNDFNNIFIPLKI